MKLRKFDVIDFLDSDEAVVEYLNALNVRLAIAMDS